MREEVRMQKREYVLDSWFPRRINATDVHLYNKVEILRGNELT